MISIRTNAIPVLLYPALLCAALAAAVVGCNDEGGSEKDAAQGEVDGGGQSDGGGETNSDAGDTGDAGDMSPSDFDAPMIEDSGGPGGRGAPCSSHEDCIDSTCSPITDTCGGCFAEGHACGAASECCGAICNVDGFCGLTVIPAGESCVTSGSIGGVVPKPDTRCASGTYCNIISGLCTAGCEQDNDCPNAAAVCFDTYTSPHQGWVNGVCVDTCTGTSDCATSKSGMLCESSAAAEGKACVCNADHEGCPPSHTCVGYTTQYSTVWLCTPG